LKDSKKEEARERVIATPIATIQNADM